MPLRLFCFVLDVGSSSEQRLPPAAHPLGRPGPPDTLAVHDHDEDLHRLRKVLTWEVQVLHQQVDLFSSRTTVLLV